MFSARIPVFLLGGLTIAVVVAVFCVLPRTGSIRESKAKGASASPGNLSSPPPSALGKTASPSKGWAPPEGDPVLRYKDLRNSPAQARKDLIADFMALGHDRNSFMLIEALRDPDAGVRLFAVESASTLSLAEATTVLAAASSSPDPAVREMTWSLSAPYPAESRATIFSGALRQGDDLTLNEALSELRIRPEKVLFEVMLTEAIRPGIEAARETVLFRELREWLVPGGGAIPSFESPAQMAEWWHSNLVHYDEYLLRTDPNP